MGSSSWECVILDIQTGIMDANNLKYLKKLIKLMKSEGVLSLKQQDLDIQLTPSALTSVEPTSEGHEPTPAQSTYTEEDALFWSSTGIGAENPPTQ